MIDPVGSAALIFVTEGLFIYIYFLLFEENRQNRISKTNFSNDFAIFFIKRFFS